MSLRRDALRAGIALGMTMLVVATTAFAGDESAGTRAASFLASSPTPAIQGRAGAGLALETGVQGAWWNSATLASVQGFTASFAHATLADEVDQAWLGSAGRLGGAWRWGVSGVYRNEGSYELRDADNVNRGSEVARSLAIGVQLGRPLGSWLEIGGGARYVGEHMGTYHGNGAAFDAGARARVGAFSFAVAGRNFGGGMSWQGQRWRMPATLATGIAVDDPASGMRFALDLTAPSNYHRDVRAGIEWQLGGVVAMRAGYRHELGALEGEGLSGPAFGAGTGWNGLWVDYSYDAGTMDLAEHRVSLSLLPRRGGARGAAPSLPSSLYGPPTRP